MKKTLKKRLTEYAKSTGDRCENCYWWWSGSSGYSCHHHLYHEIKPCGSFEMKLVIEEDPAKEYEEFQKMWN